MKATFAALAMAGAAQAIYVKKDAEIISGLFWGITEEKGLTDLDDCVYGTERFVMQLVHGVEMIVEADLRSIISGTRSISRAIHQLPSDLNSCAHSVDDVAKLVSWATIFLRHDNLVQRIVYNVEHNPEAVTFDVLRLRKVYKEEEWFLFGEDLGKFLVLVTQPIDPAALQEAIWQD